MDGQGTFPRHLQRLSGFVRRLPARCFLFLCCLWAVSYGFKFGCGTDGTRTRRLVAIAPVSADWYQPTGRETGTVWVPLNGGVDRGEVTISLLLGPTWASHRLLHDFRLPGISASLATVDVSVRNGTAGDVSARVSVQLWLLALPLAPSVARRLARYLRRRRLQPGRCPACGYDLRATPDRCPECGAPAPAGSDRP